MPSIQWKTVKEYEDITYKKCNGVARIAFNRPRLEMRLDPKQHLSYTKRYMMPMKIQVLEWFY